MESKEAIEILEEFVSYNPDVSKRTWIQSKYVTMENYREIPPTRNDRSRRVPQ